MINQIKELKILIELLREILTNLSIKRSPHPMLNQIQRKAPNPRLTKMKTPPPKKNNLNKNINKPQASMLSISKGKVDDSSWE